MQCSSFSIYPIIMSTVKSKSGFESRYSVSLSWFNVESGLFLDRGDRDDNSMTKCRFAVMCNHIPEF